jgi:hypothetical protein
MNIEEQIRDIVKEEINLQFTDLEKRLEEKVEREITDQLEDLRLLTKKLEDDLSNRWGLLVSLRKYTLEQLMAEYKKLTGSLRPEQEDSVEHAEI